MEFFDFLNDYWNKNIYVLDEHEDACSKYYIFSDYGGEHAESKYMTFSFLIISSESLKSIYDGIGAFREKYFLRYKDKEIAYKNLKNIEVKAGLKDYLKLGLEKLEGHLVTFVVSKKLKSKYFFGDKNKYAALISKIFHKEGKDSFKPDIIPKIILVSLFMAFITSRYIPRTSSVKWISDDDPVLKGKNREATEQILSDVIKNIDQKFEKVSNFGSYQEISSDYQSLDQDILSYTDLAAGILSDIVSDTDADKVTCEEHKEIQEWLFAKGRLKKSNIKIDLNNNAGKYIYNFATI